MESLEGYSYYDTPTGPQYVRNSGGESTADARRRNNGTKYHPYAQSRRPDKAQPSPSAETTSQLLAAVDGPVALSSLYGDPTTIDPLSLTKGQPSLGATRFNSGLNNAEAQVQTGMVDGGHYYSEGMLLADGQYMGSNVQLEKQSDLWQVCPSTQYAMVPEPPASFPLSSQEGPVTHTGLAHDLLRSEPERFGLQHPTGVLEASLVGQQSSRLVGPDASYEIDFPMLTCWPNNHSLDLGPQHCNRADSSNSNRSIKSTVMSEGSIRPPISGGEPLMEGSAHGKSSNDLTEFEMLSPTSIGIDPMNQYLWQAPDDGIANQNLFEYGPFYDFPEAPVRNSATGSMTPHGQNLPQTRSTSIVPRSRSLEEQDRPDPQVGVVGGYFAPDEDPPTLAPPEINSQGGIRISRLPPRKIPVVYDIPAIPDMTVSQLKIELKKRNLSAVGKKTDLQARLAAHTIET